jgi:hypothetical protein
VKLKWEIRGKILSVFFTVVIGLWILPHRWGVNPVADIQSVLLAVLSLVPNRWLVCSRVSFIVFLLVTLFPFHVLFPVSVFTGVDAGSMAVSMFMVVCLFAPLPLSLIFSRTRFQRGEKFVYA